MSATTRKLETMPVPKLEKTIEQARETLAQLAKEAPTARTSEARDAFVAKARETKALRDAAKNELALREAREKQSVFERLFASQAQTKRRKEKTPTPAEAERKAFHE